MTEDKFYEKSIKSDTIYDGKILKLRVDTVELVNKKYSKREIVDHQKGVGIIAFDEDNKLWMVKQYRKAIDKVTLEVPAGKTAEEVVFKIPTAKKDGKEYTAWTEGTTTALYFALNVVTSAVNSVA